jgi:hypothetical protein
MSQFLNKALPYVNFLVASSALLFQTTVLYPWHHQLDKDFHLLKEEQNAKLAEFHTLKLERLDHIEQIVRKMEQRSNVQHAR